MKTNVAPRLLVGAVTPSRAGRATVAAGAQGDASSSPGGRLPIRVAD
ncbi:MAG: hypothetical protein AW07_02960 [Candidatus Accumulibacter sp. SK-11]|nr:MAG: hypothetical protein AW07_02960 [Candidatus Accumulibacter sp. SK-11]